MRHHTLIKDNDWKSSDQIRTKNIMQSDNSHNKCIDMYIPLVKSKVW